MSIKERIGGFWEETLTDIHNNSDHIPYIKLNLNDPVENSYSIECQYCGYYVRFTTEFFFDEKILEFTKDKFLNKILCFKKGKHDLSQATKVNSNLMGDVINRIKEAAYYANNFTPHYVKSINHEPEGLHLVCETCGLVFLFCSTTILEKHNSSQVTPSTDRYSPTAHRTRKNNELYDYLEEEKHNMIKDFRGINCADTPRIFEEHYCPEYKKDLLMDMIRKKTSHKCTITDLTFSPYDNMYYQDITCTICGVRQTIRDKRLHETSVKDIENNLGLIIPTDCLVEIKKITTGKIAKGIQTGRSTIRQHKKLIKKVH